MKDHQQLREQLGTYVLGQLDPAGRDEVQDHLSGCPSCRAEVADLAPVVAALDRLGPVPVDENEVAVDPQSQLGELDARRQSRARGARVRRALGSVLVAATVAAAFGLGTWYAGPRTDPPVVEVPMTLDQPGLTADAGLVRHTWGTELKLEATGLAAGQSYAVTFLTEDGGRVSAGTFLGTGTRPVRCSVNAAIAVDDARRVEVTDARGVLVMDADLR